MKKTNDGSPMMRYDIPPELLHLLMAEKLLVRRCAPYIPSHHLKGGNFGLKGHCVAFAQDITEMCDELPNRKETVVTFVREMGNKSNHSMLLRHLKVNKKGHKSTGMVEDPSQRIQGHKNQSFAIGLDE